MMTETETDVLDQCEGLDEILLLTYQLEGPGALQELLDALVDSKKIYRESFEQAALSFDDAGLALAAQLTAEAAEAAERVKRLRVEFLPRLPVFSLIPTRTIREPSLLLCIDLGN
jgi:hypothetical protein